MSGSFTRTSPTDQLPFHLGPLPWLSPDTSREQIHRSQRFARNTVDTLFLPRMGIEAFTRDGFGDDGLLPSFFTFTENAEYEVCVFHYKLLFIRQ
jgi:hypothetical protein